MVRKTELAHIGEAPFWIQTKKQDVNSSGRWVESVRRKGWKTNSTCWPAANSDDWADMEGMQYIPDERRVEVRMTERR